MVKTKRKSKSSGKKLDEFKLIDEKPSMKDMVDIPKWRWWKRRCCIKDCQEILEEWPYLFNEERLKYKLFYFPKAIERMEKKLKRQK